MVLANGQRAGFFIGDGAGVGKGRQVSIFVFVQFHAVTTWSMNCYFVYVDKNQEWWQFSLWCKFTSFSCSLKHLSHFHVKTNCDITSVSIALKPCESTQEIIGISMAFY